MLAEMILGAANRIGLGHDGDIALDAAFSLGLGQHRHQRIDSDHARQFAGVKGGLQIGRGSCLVAAFEAEDREFVGNAFTVTGDALDRFLHDLLHQEREDMPIGGADVDWSSLPRYGRKRYSAGAPRETTGAGRSIVCDITATATASSASAAPTSGRLA